MNVPQIKSLGVIGGSGMLGGAIVRGLLDAGAVARGGLWIAGRSGSAGPNDPTRLHVTTDAAELVDHCETILYCVPPAAAQDWRIDAPDRLILSVMAGVTRDALADLSGASRVIRAMSSPAAAQRLAYSPWIASDHTAEADKAIVRRLFGAIGLEDEVPDEDHIDQFTAITGPVPGFVAFFAEAMQGYATDAGIPARIADRAIRQLFRASGRMLSEDAKTAEQHVDEMIDYAGTTAAGLEVMRNGPIREAIAAGLAAAYARTKTIG